jgi:hypothetical protein
LLPLDHPNRNVTVQVVSSKISLVSLAAERIRNASPAAVSPFLVGPTDPPSVSHPPPLCFRLHHGQLLEASIIVSRYIDACLLPFHPLFLFHTQSTTSFNLHTSKHQQPSLDSLNPLYLPTIILSPNNQLFLTMPAMVEFPPCPGPPPNRPLPPLPK